MSWGPGFGAIGHFFLQWWGRGRGPVGQMPTSPAHGIKKCLCTGDDDSTTERFLHAQVPYGIEKFSDIIHIKQSLTFQLHKISTLFLFVN